MTWVKAWLLTNPNGGRYDQVALSLGLSPNRVCNAALDLHLFDPDLVVSVPAPKNHYTLRAGWNETSKRGESNQARHASTRLYRIAERWEKAAGQEPDLALAAMLRMAARNARNEAAELEAVAAAIDAHV